MAGNTGIHYRICNNLKLDLTSQKTSQASALVLILAARVEVHGMTELNLVARTHPGSGNTMGTGNTLTVGLLPDGYDFGDPASQFLGAAIASPVTLAAAPSYGIQTVTSGFGRMVAVQLILTTGTVLPIVYLSVDVTAKGGDPEKLLNGPNSFMGYRIQ